MIEPKQPPGNGPAPADDSSQGDAASLVVDETASLRAERDQLLALLKRTQADFENYQKRNNRTMQEERRFANAPLAIDLLGTIDNLDRALAAARKTGEKGPLVEG